MNKTFFIRFSVVFITVFAACKKDRIAVAPPKTVTDYMKQMVGMHKMVGTYVFNSPIKDTFYNLEEQWEVTFLNEKSIFVKKSTGTEITFNYIRHDSIVNRLIFFPNRPIYETEILHYYYLNNSITYYGYSRTANTLYHIELYSEK